MKETIFSLEPLSYDLVSLVKQQTNFDIYFVDRITLDLPQNSETVKIIICRDRDNIDALLDNCPNLLFLFIVSVGIEKLPFKRLIERNVTVANVGGINARIMSEYTIGAILQFSARFKENVLNQSKHYWKKYQCVDSLFGKKLMIVGAGRTGKLIAEKASAFGMACIGVKKHFESVEYFDEIITLDEWKNILPFVDFVVSTIPLTQETFHLFNSEIFHLMNSKSVFINISRGNIVNQEELLEACKHNEIAGAVLDVFEKEPLDSNNELWDLPNVIITPHSSGRLEDFMKQAINLFIENINAFFAGQPLPNKIKLTNGY